MSERKPLTLEELRNAYDFSKRVGLHVLIQFDSCKCEYEGVIDHRDDDGICAVYAASGEWLKEKDYGETWLAYAYEPPRLDRSAWEPCEHCKPSKNPLDRWGPHQFPIDGNEIYFYDTDDGWEGEEINFCPWCGRPLTDAAWKMLERRLAEHDKR